MSDSTQLATREPRTVKDYLALPTYRDRFNEVLGKRANQFMAAITAVSQLPQLKEAEPRSVIASAMVAATLDLPVNPTLGQAYVVAYRDNTGTSVAQFQIGYKGIIQLALRSGQYKRMNAGPINAEVFSGYDMVGEPSLDWSKYDPTKDIGGYFCAFELLNGFTKIVYWSKAQVESHAKKFSRAYQKGFKSSPWFTDFDGMATKTVIKNALTKWGVLSVEMQKAVVHDQGTQADVDADVKYVDNETVDAGEQMPGDPPNRPAPKPRAVKGVAAVKHNASVEVVVPAEEQKAAPAPTPTPEPTPARVEQRALLHPDETITVEAMVEEFKRIEGTRSGKPFPYVTAVIVSPELRGQVSHIDNSLTPEGQPVAEWQLDQPVRVTLRGKKFANGSIANVVEKIEVIGGAAETPAEANEV